MFGVISISLNHYYYLIVIKYIIIIPFLPLFNMRLCIGSYGHSVDSK